MQYYYMLFACNTAMISLILQDIIYNIKSAFNKDFDSVARMKELEIARVKEKNIRISQIFNQLDIKEEIWVPTLTDNEKPERALVVQESEVRYLRFLMLLTW